MRTLSWVLAIVGLATTGLVVVNEVWLVVGGLFVLAAVWADGEQK